MKFELNQTYSTVKTLGVSKKADGRLQISQRIGQDGGPDIPSTEKLTFVGREGGRPWFLREDGVTKVCGHITHFDPTNAYNQGEASNAGSKLTSARARVAKIELELARAVERLAAISKELGPEGVAQAEAQLNSSEEATSSVSQEARDEAAALFAE